MSSDSFLNALLLLLLPLYPLQHLGCNLLQAGLLDAPTPVRQRCSMSVLLNICESPHKAVMPQGRAGDCPSPTRGSNPVGQMS